MSNNKNVQTLLAADISGATSQFYSSLRNL